MNIHALMIATSLVLGPAAAALGCAGGEGPLAGEGGEPHAASEPATESTGGEETWAGTGTVYDEEGVARGDYEVRLTRVHRGDVVEQTVVVELPDGETQRYEQTLEEGGNGFEMSGSAGEGGGLELGDGMIVTYSRLPDGTEHAQTIALDGEDRMRIVRTELEDGRAVRFYRETYRRK